MQDATDMVHVYDIVARQVRCELSLEAPVFCFHIIVQIATVLMLTVLHSVLYVVKSHDIWCLEEHSSPSEQIIQCGISCSLLGVSNVACVY